VNGEVTENHRPGQQKSKVKRKEARAKSLGAKQTEEINATPLFTAVHQGLLPYKPRPSLSPENKL
jgi:hypothetical protein